MHKLGETSGKTILFPLIHRLLTLSPQSIHSAFYLPPSEPDTRFGWTETARVWACCLSSVCESKTWKILLSMHSHIRLCQWLFSAALLAFYLMYFLVYPPFCLPRNRRLYLSLVFLSFLPLYIYATCWDIYDNEWCAIKHFLTERPRYVNNLPVSGVNLKKVWFMLKTYTRRKISFSFYKFMWYVLAFPFHIIHIKLKTQ